MTRRGAVLLAAILSACSVEVDGDSSGLSAGMSGPGPGSTSVGVDDDPTSTAPTSGEGSTAVDDATASGPGDEADTTSGSATSSPTTDATAGSTGDAPGDPLDPDLDVPEGGQPCLTPGSLVECPALEVCRFHTTEQGLCESCDACGNLGAPCTQGTDCDILFACYQGQCTNFCQLGTFECGPVEDCLDVGHPTHGVCAPF
ncbi:MAG: hypothetical protein KDK70_04875 [Myxococcales bacterium]|nr:hypothetical protein [Myxococcales bacterium]